jgi:hypothetical protein
MIQLRSYDISTFGFRPHFYIKSSIDPTSMSRVTNASTVLSRHHVYTNANDGFSILAVYVLVIMLRKCSLYATVPCS